MTNAELLALVRKVPDYPKPGILFYDITTALQNPEGLKAVIHGLLKHCEGKKIDKVIGTEARGFIFAPTVAYELNAGFVPVRKPNKLPFNRIGFSYELEYGTGRSWRFTRMPFNQVKTFGLSMICWRPVVRHML